jgi:hypothetical protein
MLFWNKQRNAEPVEEVRNIGLYWETDHRGGFVAYPEMAMANWERYSVTQDERTGLWVTRWQMHRMNAVIGWAMAPTDAKMFAQTHHDEEAYDGSYRI